MANLRAANPCTFHGELEFYTHKTYTPCYSCGHLWERLELRKAIFREERKVGYSRIRALITAMMSLELQMICPLCGRPL